MANQSIYAAFERMWQHIIAVVGGKAELDHTHTASEIGAATEEYVNEAIANIPVQEQVQADYGQNDETAPDYVKGRTHYRTGTLVENVEVFPMQELSPTEEGLYMLNLTRELNIGDRCVIHIGADLSYECEVKYTTIDDLSIPYIGNLAVVGLEEDTGEPFLFTSEGAGMTKSTYMGMILLEESPISISIIADVIEYEYTTIPNEYLPGIPSLGYLYSDITTFEQAQYVESLVYKFGMVFDSYSNCILNILPVTGASYFEILFREWPDKLRLNRVYYDGITEEILLEIDATGIHLSPINSSIYSISASERATYPRIRIDGNGMPYVEDGTNTVWHGDSLKSPSGKWYRMSVEDDGSLSMHNGNVKLPLKSDWRQNDESRPDHIIGRTHYYGETNAILQYRNLIPQTSNKYSDTAIYYSDFVEGKTYSIHYNGSIYYCTLSIDASHSYNGYYGMFLGNGVAIGLEDTGEPFCFNFSPNGTTFYYLDNPKSYINVSVHSVTIVKLPTEFLPDGVGYGDKTLVLPEVTFGIDSASELGGTIAQEVYTGIEAIQPNTSYRVIYNGVEYNVTSQMFSGIGILGNMPMVFGDGDNGLPFCVASMPADEDENEFIYAVMALHGEVENITCSVYKSNIHSINSKYLSADVPSKSKDTIVPITTITPDESMIGEFIANKDILAGETYTVIFNGRKYNCVGTSMSDNGETFILLGNIGMLDGSGDTGEPFVIIPIPDFIDDGVYCQILVLDATLMNRSIILSIETEEVRKIDVDCLPDSVGYKKLNTIRVLNGALVEHELAQIPSDESEGGLVEGVNYFVHATNPIDNTLIDCELTAFNHEYEGSPAVVLGNASLLGNGGADTGEKFVIITQSGITKAMHAYNVGNSMVTFVYSTDEYIHKIPTEYIPDTIARVTDDDESVDLLAEADLLPAATDASGAILTDSNGNIILRY